MKWEELISLEYGKPVKDKYRVDGKVPVFGTNGQIGTSNLPAQCKIPSVIIGRKGAYRGVHFSSVPFSVIDTAFYMMPKTDELDLKWAYYKFLTYDINRMDSGSAIPSTDRYEIYNIPIDLPSLKVQKKEVSILDAIDNKIQENERINKNLQAQAQAFFLHLFADNESVIPASIADVALNVTDGVHNTVHDDPDGKYLLLSCKNIKGGSLSIGTSERRINAETFEKLRRRTKLAKGDVLISSVGTVGKLLLVNTEPSNYEFQRSVAMVKPNPDIVSPVYLYEALLSQKAELINAAHGAVQQCLFISDIAGFPIGIPTQDDLLTFDEVVTPMFDTITANEAESIRLAALRDALLPKLMSGEIDVSDLDL